MFRAGPDPCGQCGSPGATNGSGSATVTMTFSGYGMPLSLSLPPSSQVVDITAPVVCSRTNAASG
jgi:hypothetical protein